MIGKVYKFQTWMIYFHFVLKRFCMKSTESNSNGLWNRYDANDMWSAFNIWLKQHFNIFMEIVDLYELHYWNKILTMQLCS